MNHSIESRRRLMACLGDASRHRIAQHLSKGEMCVTELAVALGLSQSCTTRHLQALGRAGLVHRRRSGKRVVFSLEERDPRVRTLLEWIGAVDGPSVPEANESQGTVDERAGGTPAPARPNPLHGRRRPPGKEGSAERNEDPDVAETRESGKRSAAEVPPDPAAVAPAPAEKPTPVLRRGDLEDYLL